jgi:hypothetical protein
MPCLSSQGPKPEAMAVSDNRFGDKSEIKHTPVPLDVDAPTHLADLTITEDDDLAYDPRKFISILGEKWDPGRVTAPKPTGYPMAPVTRTEIMTSPSHSRMRTSSPGVGHWHVDTACEKPAITRYKIENHDFIVHTHRT